MKLEKKLTWQKALQPLSRENFHTLLLCWKIRTGLSIQIETYRIKKYTDWFFQNYLLPHFDIEEKFIFPKLGNKNKLVIKAVEEHRRLRQLFESEYDVKNNLGLIEKELINYIRFEEQTLFNEIQNAATGKAFKMIETSQNENTCCGNWKDTFWKTNQTTVNS